MAGLNPLAVQLYANNPKFCKAILTVLRPRDYSPDKSSELTLKRLYDRLLSKVATMLHANNLI